MYQQQEFHFEGVAGAEKQHAQVGQASGGGGSFQIYVNRGYEGILQLVRGQWRVYLNENAISQWDDIQIFIEAIEAAGYEGY